MPRASWGWPLAWLLLRAALAAADPASAPAVPRGAPLEPTDLALIYNAGVTTSRELATYYANSRGVPQDRLIGLRLPDRDTLDRDRYDVAAAEIRRALRNGRLDDRVRCLVTFYGVPIRVGPVRPTPRQETTARQLELQFEDVMKDLREKTAAMERVARLPAPPPASAPTTRNGGVDLKTAADRFVRAKNAVAARVQTETNEDRRAAVVQEFFAIVEEVEGAGGLLAQIRARSGEGHPSAVRRLDEMRNLIRDDEEKVLELLRRPPDSPERPEARRRIRRTWGLLGAARNLQEDRAALLGKETGAAFDSELALLWWGEYPLYRWRSNPTAWRVRAQAPLRQAVPPSDWKRKVLMVSRLDGPTPAVVRRMIDDAVAAERTGLRGTFYIDARGITQDDGYRTYDQNLRDLAELMKSRSPWPTVLDDRPELFAQRSCPHAALYCGWYSLRKYVPAFTFERGAVGYHIASAEAVNLRSPGEQGWCKRMLEDGVAATLGPVDEPYLHAFPLPQDFFGLLLSGRFTLAECYAFSTNFHSWMMMLLGDPLYRPFASRAVLRLEDAFDPTLIPEEYRTATRPAK